MNNELECHLAPVVTFRRAPVLAVPDELLGYPCPKGLSALLEFSDGFITLDRCFRVFGMTNDEQIPSLEEWNKSEWVQGYGPLTEGILFIAEDVFGDQYGYRFSGGKREFIKFYCEGGRAESLEGINWFIQALATPVESGALDGELLSAAAARGFDPTANEHLAFRVPLIIGGRRDVSNLAVESVSLHLGTLSQLSLRNADLRQSSPIAGFSSEESPEKPSDSAGSKQH